MLIASIKSSKISWVNELNEVPFIGSIIIACGTMLPTFLIQELVELIFGENPAFDLSFTFFMNSLIIHLLLLYYFDIRVRIFFIPSTIFCLICMVINGYREYELILQAF